VVVGEDKENAMPGDVSVVDVEMEDELMSEDPGVFFPSRAKQLARQIL